ncbi:hypothetical protein B0T24DRAFT_19335 [Lasiosphaeria ovina]|uniref:NAD(P)-binding protein n=1 Tax=Lasiosphaeria ovina TaxID=92902 RepID=A0AAE0NJD3_9PEZI|nr:hypothetical protein B0T24DRAFT_19335 [Lasiosphaeria ovina]
MVALTEVKASNALINDATAPRVAVFVSGTAGIGKLTLKALVETGASTRIYLVGRKSAEERTRAFIDELHAINPRAEVIWTEAEVSLLAETKRVCGLIKSKEPRVDLLFLTTGYAPFGKRTETAEGIEVAQSLEYYTRVLFIQHLLPVLRQAEAPRVISVLAGGMESTWVDIDDIDLKRPGSFWGGKAQLQYGTMNSVGLDKLAQLNPDVIFIHSSPGWVSTGNVLRGRDAGSITDWLMWLVLEPLIRLFSMTDDASAQRNLFQCTSAAFGGRGVPWTGKPGVNTRGNKASGVFLAKYTCDSVENAKTMAALREKAQQKIWDHTQEVLRPYL